MTMKEKNGVLFSHQNIDVYEKLLFELKKLLETNKKYDVINIEYRAETDYTMEKIRVNIDSKQNLTLCFDIPTQYQVWSGYHNLVVRIDYEDIKKDIETIIKECRQ